MGRLEIINETTAVSVYIDIIARNLFVSASQMKFKKFIFQEDNDPKHTSKLADEFFDARGVTMWLVSTISLFEPNWKYLEAKKKFSERQPKNTNELKLLIVEEWSKISLEKTSKKYYMRFKKGTLAVYRAKDDHAKY